MNHGLKPKEVREQFKQTGEGRKSLSRLSFMLTSLGIALSTGSCSILTTRPVQEMSDTTAALRAAREVQADVAAPELYREASEAFFNARREYKFKNFNLAKEYAEKARELAEQAEFESLRAGANRTELNISDPLSNVPPPPPPPPAPERTPYPYPAPTGTPVEPAPGTAAPTPAPSTPPPPTP